MSFPERTKQPLKSCEWRKALLLHKANWVEKINILEEFNTVADPMCFLFDVVHGIDKGSASCKIERWFFRSIASQVLFFPLFTWSEVKQYNDQVTYM